MKFLVFFAFILTLLPAVAFAQEGSLQKLLAGILGFTNGTLIPFLFGIAFLIFIYNSFRYFILNGENEKGQENAKNLAIYSVAAFVFLFIFWGIVNLFTTSSGLEGKDKPCPDYLERKGGC